MPIKYFGEPKGSSQSPLSKQPLKKQMLIFQFGEPPYPLPDLKDRGGGWGNSGFPQVFRVEKVFSIFSRKSPFVKKISGHSSKWNFRSIET